MEEESLGFLTQQGARRAAAIGIIAGAAGPTLDRWEPIMVIIGVIIGEETSNGDTMLPTPAIENAPMVALVSTVIGLFIGIGINRVR